MKRIFYYTDVLPLLTKGDKAMEKLKENMEFFKAHQDEVSLVWHPFLQIGEYLQKNDSDVYEDFLEIYRWFVSEGFGELDESEDVISVVQSCDGYYGDASDLAWYACDSGSPALLIDYDVHTDAWEE